MLQYHNAYANDHSITFMPAIASTTGRLHAEFLRLLFWHAHRESEEFFKLTGQLAPWIWTSPRWLPLLAVTAVCTRT